MKLGPPASWFENIWRCRECSPLVGVGQPCLAEASELCLNRCLIRRAVRLWSFESLKEETL